MVREELAQNANDVLHADADVILAETTQTFWSYCEAAKQIWCSTSTLVQNRGQIYSSQQNVGSIKSNNFAENMYENFLPHKV